MAVTEYRADRCRYQLGSLKPYVYLLPKETTSIDFTVGGGQVQVNNIVATQITRLEGYACKLEVAETTGERLDFRTTVTLGMRENFENLWVTMLRQLREQRYYVVVEDNNGNQYIQSPEFTVDMTYTFNFNDTNNSSHNCEIRFICDSNHPVVILNNHIGYTQRLGNDCRYAGGMITDLRLVPFDYVLIDSDKQTGRFTTITCTGGEALHKVDWLKNSFSFRQQYDGRNYQERLQFKIPLSDYKYYWRYNLVEFTQNRYAIAFKTSEGTTVACGFEFGFQPTYTIETTEDDIEVNTITITLNHQGQNSIYYCADRDPEYIDSETGHFVPVTQSIKDPVSGRNLQWWHCISKSEAIYTLVQMVTDAGVPTDRYMCLEGYEATYANLNIIGTYTRDTTSFDFELVFENYDCALKDNCQFEETPDSIYHFTNAGDTATFRVYNECPWEIHDLPDWIECSRMSGDGGIMYNVTFTCTRQGVEEPVTGAGFIQSFDNVNLIQFIVQKQVDWFSPYVHNITAAAQTIYTNVFIDYDKYEVCEVPEGVTAVKEYGRSRVKIQVPENPSDSEGRIFKVKLCSTSHPDAYIIINQDIIYYSWHEITGTYICDNGNSYKMLRRYKGYSADDISIDTGEQRTGALLVENDPRCQTSGGGDGEQYRYEWRDNNESACENGNLYKILRKYESFDGGNTWSRTNECQFSDLIQESSAECADAPTVKQYRFIVDESEYICDGTASYYKEYEWYSYDSVNWFLVYPLVSQKSSQIRKENDPMCGGGGTDPTYNERWVNSGRTTCFEGDLYNLLQLQTSNDGGVTWITQPEYKRGTRIEEDSDQCGEDPEWQIDWKIDYGRYVCDGTTSYYIEVKYYSSNGLEWIKVEPEEWRRSETVRGTDDVACGGGGGDIYKWEWDGESFVCSGDDKYQRVDQWVSHDNGTTWSRTGLSRMGDLIAESTTECEGHVTQYRWVVDESAGWECNGTTSYWLERQQWSEDGVNWINTSNTRRSTTVRLENDTDCGYVPPTTPIYRWAVDTTGYMCVEEDDGGGDNNL